MALHKQTTFFCTFA